MNIYSWEGGGESKRSRLAGQLVGDDLRTNRIDEAFASFKRALDLHCSSMVVLRVDPSSTQSTVLPATPLFLPAFMSSSAPCLPFRSRNMNWWPSAV